MVRANLGRGRPQDVQVGIHWIDTKGRCMRYEAEGTGHLPWAPPQDRKAVRSGQCRQCGLRARLLAHLTQRCPRSWCECLGAVLWR